MTRDEAAAALDGNQYREEGSTELFRAMKAAGLVAVYGASDDLMEFEGAIRDEVGVYNGGIAYLNRKGLIANECESDNCPYHKQVLKDAPAAIEAVWDSNGFSWQYKTSLPHSKFIIKEDGENYCEGIVFSLADISR
ncbi:hypothetical protein [Bradyrhizobium japonicum]|uniref:hypothetical protein n=1 Tax=Bradyrhizobium japonicum TaxID=375 RepID=UPI000405855F|nr:hypothetical protein [Bradyrhizobium japonicum]